MYLRRLAAAVCGIVLVLVAAAAADAATWDSGTTSRVSLRSVGGQSGPGSVSSTAISSSGRYVAFTSTASNLVQNDINGRADVFLRDRVAGTTKRINVDTHGKPFGNGNYAQGVIMSADGRYVAYTEYDAAMPPDTDVCSTACYHSYWRDLRAGTVRDLGVNWTVVGTGMSSDGRFVVVNGADDESGHWAAVRDMKTDDLRALPSEIETRYTKAGNISSDGRYVVFVTDQNPLPPFSLTHINAYVEDLTNGNLRLLSVTRNGGNEDVNGVVGVPVISGDGTRAAFSSAASNLVGADTNGKDDAFLRNLQANTTVRISIGPAGQQANAAAGRPQLSDTGRYVGWSSSASNLVTGDTNRAGDVFVRDLTAGVTRRASMTTAEKQANGASTLGQISGDGLHIAFASAATNLVTGDTNHSSDVFARDVVAPH